MDTRDSESGSSRSPETIFDFSSSGLIWKRKLYHSRSDLHGGSRVVIRRELQGVWTLLLVMLSVAAIVLLLVHCLARQTSPVLSATTKHCNDIHIELSGMPVPLVEPSASMSPTRKVIRRHHSCDSTTLINTRDTTFVSDSNTSV